jgi:hypothetical protein
MTSEAPLGPRGTASAEPERAIAAVSKPQPPALPSPISSGRLPAKFATEEAARVDHRRSLIHRRWRRVAALVGVGAAAASGVALLLPPLLDPLPRASLGAAGCFVLAILLYRVAGHVERVRAPGAAASCLAHPPYWLASVPGAFVVAAVVLFNAGLGSGYVSPMIGLALLSVVYLLALAGQDPAGRVAAPGAARLAAPTSPSVSDAPLSDADWCDRWLLHDGAVERSEDDLLGHAPVAARMAARLRAPRMPSQCVIGPLGSGKTTIRKLVEAHLAPAEAAPLEGRVVIVAVEMARYQTVLAAVEGILRELMDRMEEHLDLMSVRGLPEAYGHAMTAGGGMWAAIARLQGTPQTQREQLQALDDIATAAGARYVVWVEDLERFGGGLATSGESVADAAALGPIRALLHGLGELRSIQVVMATTSLSAGVDVGKIARYVESVPGLESGALVRAVARSLRLMESVSIRTPPGCRRSARGLGVGEWDARWQSALWRRKPDARPHLQIALASLVATPRAMKLGLRRAREAWGCEGRRGPLWGEIDPEALVVGGLLAAAQPSLFAWVASNLPSCRAQAGAAWEGRAKAWTDLRVPDAGAAEVVIAFLFGEAGAFHGGDDSTDYWRRFLSESADEPSDQSILGDLDSASVETRFGVFLSPESADRALRFAEGLPPDEIWTLWSQGVERWRAAGLGPEDELDGSGLRPMIQLVRNLVWTDRVTGLDVIEQLRHTHATLLPGNLALALLLEYHLVHPRGSAPIAATEDCWRMWEGLRQKLLESSGASTTSLIKALDSRSNLTLAFLLPPPPAGGRPGEWAAAGDFLARLTPLLSLAFREAQDVVGRQLAGLLVRPGRAPVGTQAPMQLDDQVLRETFGTRQELRRLFPCQGDEPWMREADAEVLVRILRPMPAACDGGPGAELASADPSAAEATSPRTAGE